MSCGGCGMTSSCAECRRERSRQRTKERYWRLKKAGINPNIPSTSQSNVAAAVDAMSDTIVCNHCGQKQENVKALIKHKETHGLFIKPTEQVSLLPSTVNWNG